MQQRKRVREKVICILLLLVITSAMYAQTVEEALLKSKINTAVSRTGIPAADVESAIIAKTYKDKNTGIEYIYLQQTYKRIPIYNSIKTLAFKGSNLVYSSGKWIDKTDRKSYDTHNPDKRC